MSPFLRHRFLAPALCFCALVFCLAPSLHAQDKTPPDPAAHTVFIPFDKDHPVASQKPQRYYLDRADFDRLWSLAKENRRPEDKSSKDAEAKPQATLTSALYRGTIEPKRLTMEVQYQVSTRGHWAKLALGMTEAAKTRPGQVHDVTVDGRPSTMTDGAMVFEQPGIHAVHAAFDFVVDEGWNTADLRLPAASAAMLSLKLPDQDALPVFESRDLVPVEETLNGTRTATVSIGSATAVRFTRWPRRALSTTPPPAADVTIVTTLSEQMRLSAEVKARFTFPGSARKEVAVNMDPDWTLASAPAALVGGQAISDFRVGLRNEAGRQLVVATLPREISDELTLVLHLVPRGNNPAHTPLIAPGAGHWETTAELVAEGGVRFTARPAPGQQRLAVNRYRLGPSETLAFDAQPPDDKTEARIDYVFQLSEQKQEVAAAIALHRTRGVWRQLRVGLAPGMEIQSVQSPNVAAWELQNGELFLRFNELTGTEARVVVYVASTVLKPSMSWTVSPFTLPGIGKIKGNAIVASHAATEARLAGFQQQHDLREVDPATLTAIFTLTAPLEKKRAIEFERPEWKLQVELQDLATRFSADGILLVQATDLGVLVSQQVSIDVEQGALKHLVLRLPASLPEATVTGDQLREVQVHAAGALREYDCTFQSQGGLLGNATVTLDMQLPLTDAELAAPFVEVADAGRLRRWFVLDNSSSRESKVLKSDGVDACARDALPYVPAVLTQPQYFQGRSSGGLKVAFTQLLASSGNAAIVTLADITTVLRADGERWDTVIYSLTNRSLQFLPVVLPEGAELMAVTVSGEAVRADEEQRQGRRVRLVPLIQTRPGERSMEVRIVYRLKGPALHGHVTFKDPELLGLSAERTVWTASVPEGWTVDETLRDTFGNMEPIAQEGREVEKVESLMSDLSRINRAVSSSKDAEFNKQAIREAEKLGRQISEATEGLEKKFSLYERSYEDGGKLGYKVREDVSKVKRELDEQTIVLTENRVKQPVFSGQITLGNTWSYNADNASQTLKNGRMQSTQDYAGYLHEVQESKKLADDARRSGLSQAERAQAETAARTQGEKVKAMEQQYQLQSTSTVGLNDNIAVSNSFFSGASGGNLVLNGFNTYSGGIVLNGGTLTLAANAGTILNSTSSPGTLSLDHFDDGVTNKSAAATLTLGGTTVAQQKGLDTGLGVQYEARFNGQSTLNVASNARAYGNANAQVNDNAGIGSNGLRYGTAAITPAAPFAKPTGETLTLSGTGAVGGNAVVADNIELLRGGSPQKPVASSRAAESAPADPFGAPPDAARVAGGAKAKVFSTAHSRAPEQHMFGLQPRGSAGSPLPQALPAAPPVVAAAPATPAAPQREFKMAAAAAPPPADKVVESEQVTTLAVSQLRPTGRQSLQINVPLSSQVFHFRKLKDHAVLDLPLKHPWSAARRSQAVTFGIGLGLWLLLAFICSRLRLRRQRKLAAA